MIGGIAAYTALLGSAMGDVGHRSIISWQVLPACAPARHSGTVRRKPSYSMPLRPTISYALKELEAETVLLHYSGYGYAPRGAPFWLVEGLEHWKKFRARHR